MNRRCGAGGSEGSTVAVVSVRFTQTAEGSLGMHRFIPLPQYLDSAALWPNSRFAPQGGSLWPNVLRNAAKRRSTLPGASSLATEFPGIQMPHNGFTTFRQAIRTPTVHGLVPKS